MRYTPPCCLIALLLAMVGGVDAGEPPMQKRVLADGELDSQWSAAEATLRPDAAPHARLITPVRDRPGHDRRYALDNEKLHALGWKHSRTFDKALEQTIKWYVDNEWWWRKIKSGEFRKYYEQQYGTRLNK